VSLELRAIEDADTAALAELLSARHAAHRVNEPLLAEADAAEEVRSLLAQERLTGAVAVRDGAAVGYLAGALRRNDVWGTHAWVDLAGHAATDAEVVRDLYARVAPDWIAAGARLHLALVPATPEAMDPWYRLGFAQMQVHAIRPSGAEAAAAPAGVGIRAGRPADLEHVARVLGPLIWEHQAGPAAFTGLTPPNTLLAEWLETFSEQSDTLFLAERDGDLVGLTLLYEPPAELGTPPGAVRLAAASVLPSARGQGIGRALAEHAFAWAAAAGYGTIVADWRIPNLEASRFWPARGFRPAFHRMSRMTGTG